MDTAIIHILVIWSKAEPYKTEILSDLRNEFEILKIFTGHWEKEKFLQNYMIFYAHSQYKLDKDSYEVLLQRKIDHCGDGDFTVVVLRDDHPQFEKRITSSGEREVNIRMFDKKTQYRVLTGGGHKIHSSDDAWETNHDLTLMFGQNTEDFLKTHAIDGSTEVLNNNCVGVGGYSDIQQLFYVLNNTIQYVVLRNHECIPDEYTVDGHGDIDLLVENKNYMAYLTGAKKIYPEEYRVYHTISIRGEEVPFDFRYVGDNYYDEPWQNRILQNRILQKGLFYTPDKENQYYSLLYHAYIQKWEVKDDYFLKLQIYAEAINVIFQNDECGAVRQLDLYLAQNRYEYTRPQDSTVVYNQNNLALSKYAFRYGQLIKRLNVNDGEGGIYHSRVYEKKESFVKIGTKSLIDNEAKYLHKMKGCWKFPQVLLHEYDKDNEESILETTRMKGSDYLTFFSDINHQRGKYVRSFLLGCIELLKQLANRQVAHRDFLPSNLIINEENGKCVVSLIDFGWASDIDNIEENRPKYLGGRYVNNGNMCDSYSLGTFLLDYWYDLPYIRIIGKELRSISSCEYKSQSIINKLSVIASKVKYWYTPYDSWRLLCRRHTRIGWIKNKILNVIKNKG